jgi:hypothetical protein
LRSNRPCLRGSGAFSAVGCSHDLGGRNGRGLVEFSGMAKRGGSVHVATVRKRGTSGNEHVSHLLRRSYREGAKVKHQTLGNLSHLPEPIVDAIRKMLAGKTLVDLDEGFEIERSLPHGHVHAVLGLVRELDLERLVSRERGRERDLSVAMICQLGIGAGSKLSMTRRFSQTTLSEELALGQVTERELLAALVVG